MQGIIHGTINDAVRQHPVCDQRHWESEFPIGEERRNRAHIHSPVDLAYVEQARRLAASHGDLGPSVPADVFVWADSVDNDRPWLTRLGGDPWRPYDRPWPRDGDGQPLLFFGQICFVDSTDILRFELPGEVLLLFGSGQADWAFPDAHSVVEWSPIELRPKPSSLETPWRSRLPFELQGVIHRTRQFLERRDGPFEAAGFKKGSFELADVQATSIGTRAGIPQGWPFEKDDGCTLLATLNSYYCRGDWPLCDVPRELRRIHPKGGETSACNQLTFSVGDAGCLFVYRDAEGVFRLDGDHH